MKKIFFFAVAALAALSVNAKVVTFTDIIDKTSAETALSTATAAFDVANIELKAEANSGGTAYYAAIYQVNSTSEWGVTTLKLKGENQVYFDFKDSNKNKLVMKYWADYAQPNGKAVALVITGLKAGDKIKLNLKEALNKEAKIEGATVATHMLDATTVELQSMGSEIRVYSQSVTTDSEGKTTDAKWKLVSVEVPDGSQGINDVNANAKAEKFFRDGQLIIRKNGVEYNALGVQL